MDDADVLADDLAARVQRDVLLDPQLGDAVQNEDEDGNTRDEREAWRGR